MTGIRHDDIPRHNSPSGTKQDDMHQRSQTRDSSPTKKALSALGGVVMLLGCAQMKHVDEEAIRSAALDAKLLKNTAELFQSLDGSPDVCPTIEDLVRAKKIEAKKTVDPWGTPYKIECAKGEVHGVSAGKDRQPGTADDVRDDVTSADIQRILAL
ncbi:MAG: hypothetical protein U0359_24250 [Byssovorax sp.]